MALTRGMNDKPVAQCEAAGHDRSRINVFKPLWATPQRGRAVAFLVIPGAIVLVQRLFW